MTERYTLEQFEADKQAREEEARKEQEHARERVLEGNQKRLWISEGGTAETFETAWPRIKAAMETARAERVVAQEHQARSAMAEHSRI
jgi:hypothetical protein